MNISYEEYSYLTKQASPNTKPYKTLPAAFVVGGLICAVGEVFRQIFTSFGLDKLSAGAWVSIILIFFTALFTGLGLFHKLAKVAGAGTFVPITGFANAVVSPALEFQTEGMVLGLAAKMFVIAGPVIVYGSIASVVYGIIYAIVLMGGGAAA